LSECQQIGQHHVKRVANDVSNIQISFFLWVILLLYSAFSDISKNYRSHAVNSYVLTRQCDMLGARSPKPDSEISTERELVNPPTTHSVRLDASATSSPLVAISPTEGETDSSAALAIAVKMTGELENIGSLVNSTPEHLRGGIAVGVNNAVATASEDLPQVKFVTPDAAVDDAVSTHFSPRNASDRNDESAGRCSVENADEADDPTAKVHHGGALSHFVPSGTQTSVGNPERRNDELEGDRNKVVVSAPTVADSEAAQRQCQNLEEIPMTTCTSRKEECLEVILVLDTGTQANDGDSELIGKEGCNQKLDSSVLGVSTTCSVDADLKHSEDAGLLSIVCTTPEDGHAAICDLHQQQGTGSPTEEASVSRSGQTKLLSHPSCVAIKKAISIGRSRKRRREKDHQVTNPKRVRQIEPKQRVALSGFQTDGSILPSSVPSTPTNNEKRMSVESIVKPEPVMSEPENRTVVIHDLIHEPLWVLALPRAREGKVAAMETPKLPTGKYSEFVCKFCNVAPTKFNHTELPSHSLPWSYIAKLFHQLTTFYLHAHDRTQRYGTSTCC
jgi:hypothetical protein